MGSKGSIEVAALVFRHFSVDGGRLQEEVST